MLRQIPFRSQILGGIDAEHGGPEHSVELAKHRIAQSCRTALDHTLHDSAYSVAIGFHLLDQLDHARGSGRIRTPHYIAVYYSRIVSVVREGSSISPTLRVKA